MNETVGVLSGAYGATIAYEEGWGRKKEPRLRPECASCNHVCVCREELKTLLTGECPYYEMPESKKEHTNET